MTTFRYISTHGEVRQRNNVASARKLFFPLLSALTKHEATGKLLTICEFSPSAHEYKFQLWKCPSQNILKENSLNLSFDHS